jgi:hypothetical protein
MHYGIGIGAKLHLIKNPDKTRENLRVQVENFKIELKRLQANVPVTVLIFSLFFVIMVIRTSIPYFAGLALDAYGYGASFNFSLMMDSCFRSAFHQMVTGLFPLPGSAGVSELFFAAMYSNYYVETAKVVDGSLQIVRTASANMATANILWRVATFHLVVIVSGFFAALYHSRPHEDFHYANRQTFVDLQMATFDERKLSSDTLYETKQLSRKELQKKIQILSSSEAKDPDASPDDAFFLHKNPATPAKNPAATPLAPKAKKGNEDPLKKKKWDSIDIDD